MIADVLAADAGKSVEGEGDRLYSLSDDQLRASACHVCPQADFLAQVREGGGSAPGLVTVVVRG